MVEVKSADDDAWLTADSGQGSRYRGRYCLVLVTNRRETSCWSAETGRSAEIEAFRVAASVAEFDRLLQKPRAFAREVGAGLGESLCRAPSHRAQLAEPKDMAARLVSKE